MVATARIQFPDDMTRATRPSDAASVEAFAAKALERIKDYAKDEPATIAVWAFGIGFVLGWKLKPW